MFEGGGRRWAAAEQSPWRAVTAPVRRLWSPRSPCQGVSLPKPQQCAQLPEEPNLDTWALCSHRRAGFTSP